MAGMITQLQDLFIAMGDNLLFAAKILGAIWAVHIVNMILRYRLNILGIYPRHLWGLLGIFFAPFLHGSFNHLFFNSFPLFVMGSMVMLYGLKTFYVVSAIIIVLSGFTVWLIGRRAFHVGASGLLMGYWGFLLIRAYYEPTVMAIVLGAVTLFYFGGLVMDLMPDKAEVSWEAHLSGFAAGIASHFLAPQILLQLQS